VVGCPVCDQLSLDYREQLPLWKPSPNELYAALTPRERVYFWLVLVNFVAFIILRFVLGGNALNGGAHSGHYFLGSGRSQTDVSFAIFACSFLHTFSLFITHPLGVVISFRAHRRALQR
jgi:hypothetical protein